jgi:adenosylhomocysteinase
MADGRRLFLLADGRLVSLGAAESHPALVMDMSFATGRWASVAALPRRELKPEVYGIPNGSTARSRGSSSSRWGSDRSDDGRPEGLRVLGWEPWAAPSGYTRPRSVHARGAPRSSPPSR